MRQAGLFLLCPNPGRPWSRNPQEAHGSPRCWRVSGVGQRSPAVPAGAPSLVAGRKRRMFCLPLTTSAVHFPWPTHTRILHATRALRVCGWALPHSGTDTDLAPGVGLDSVRRPRRREFRKALHPGSRPRREASDGSPTSLRGWSPGPTAHVCRDPSIGALMLGRGSAALDAATPDGSHRPAALSGPTRDDHAGRVLEWPDALRSRRREAPGASAWGSIRRAGPG